MKKMESITNTITMTVFCLCMGYAWSATSYLPKIDEQTCRIECLKEQLLQAHSIGTKGAIDLTNIKRSKPIKWVRRNPNLKCKGKKS
jgi:hypothetical protein